MTDLTISPKKYLSGTKCPAVSKLLSELAPSQRKVRALGAFMRCCYALPLICDEAALGLVFTILAA
jgi:hypothetical protein